ncbi:MAG: glycoside hydrolase family 2 protein [Clostridia bacterium]|nr:glycoside hydrolase family 2 protein [Clostridia bacterium]
MRNTYALNFGWKYSPEFSEDMIKKSFDDSAFETVDIPHANKELPLNYFDEGSYQFISCYRKNFDIKKSAGMRYLLHFEGAAVYSRVYLNDKFIGEYKGAYNRFSFDITEVVKSKGNLLVVELDSSERKEIPPFGNVVDYLVYGGIYREVWIEEVPEIYIDNAFVRTLNVLHEKKLMSIDVTLSESTKGKLSFALYSADEKLSEKSTDFSGRVINAKWAVKDVKLWDIDNPNLYTLKIKLDDKDEISVRFGFRECRFYKDGFYLNGKKIKIRGLNRHQSFPYVGYAMPENVQKADADLLKYELGVNLVRTSHYPNSIHFLDRCDEIGLLVFTEMPSWQHLGEGEWRDICLDNVRRMVLRDRNHPSVILWGVRVNEGLDCDEFYTETNRVARELDDTRQTGGVRNMPFSHLLEDVYTMNDFTHSGGPVKLLPPALVTKSLKAPYLVTEHNGHMFPTKSFDKEGVRAEHALRHTRVLNSAYGNSRTSGAIGWCMSDYNTHKDFGSGDRICYHGVTDMFRVPKLGAAIYRSQREDAPFLEVSSAMDIGEHPGGTIGDVWVFTNCDYVKIYKNGKYTSTIYPDSSPFKNLPHPPMIAADFIGDSLTTDDGIEGLAAELLTDTLVAAQTKQWKMPPTKFLKAGAAMVIGKIPFGRMFDIVTKYIGGWGNEQITYAFEGYKDGECVATVVRTAVTDLHLDVKADSLTLKEGNTYDATRIQLVALDQNNNRVPFADSAVKVTVKGAAEIIGPSEFPLVGGDRAFWIRTNGEKGDITVTIDAKGIGKTKLQLKAE